VSGAGAVGSFVSDPLGSLAKACADAATWVIDKLAAVVNATTQVDFSNSGFLRVYAVIFGAATFLTLILWILAVAKRAVRGVQLSTPASSTGTCGVTFGDGSASWSPSTSPSRC